MHNPIISQIKIKNTYIPTPPYKEQKRIVAILDEAFAGISQVIANTEKNLANARELLESTRLEIFDNLSLTSQQLTLSEACKEIFAGGDAPKHSLSETKNSKFSIPIFANAVKDNGLYGYTETARVTEPSVTVAGRGSGTGHAEVRKEPFLPIVRLIVLTPDTDLINVEFLYYAIRNLDILRSGSAIPQLTVPMLKEYIIPVPDLKIQMKVVSDINQMKLKLDQLEKGYKNKLINLAELKQSLLQKAFSGELTANNVDKLVNP